MASRASASDENAEWLGGFWKLDSIFHRSFPIGHFSFVARCLHADENDSWQMILSFSSVLGNIQEHADPEQTNE